MLGRLNTLGESKYRFIIRYLEIPEREEEDDSDLEMVYEKNEQRFITNDGKSGDLVVLKGPQGA